MKHKRTEITTKIKSVICEEKKDNPNITREALIQYVSTQNIYILSVCKLS